MQHIPPLDAVEAAVELSDHDADDDQGRPNGVNRPISGGKHLHHTGSTSPICIYTKRWRSQLSWPEIPSTIFF